MRCAALIPLMVVLSIRPGVAQRRSMVGDPARWTAYTGAFDAFAKRDSVVGASTLLLHDGKTTAHHEYGWADRERKQRVEERTIFHWASITKTLTAIAIMQLRDRGKLSLDDKIIRYVPELRQVHDSFGSIDEITIRMLLSHSAGFQDPTWPYKRGLPWEPFEPTRWEQLVSMMPYQEIVFRPGSRFGYSNPAFIYLARVIEQLTGDPYQNYIQKNIWTPLGLGWSYFGTTPYHLAPWRSNNYTVRRDSSDRVRVQGNGPDFNPGITIPNSGWNAPLTRCSRLLELSCRERPRRHRAGNAVRDGTAAGFAGGDVARGGARRLPGRHTRCRGTLVLPVQAGTGHPGGTYRRSGQLSLVLLSPARYPKRHRHCAKHHQRGRPRRRGGRLDGHQARRNGAAGPVTSQQHRGATSCSIPVAGFSPPALVARE